MVTVEALSYSLPVLCFNNYGAGEIVDETCGVRIEYSTYSQSVKDFSTALEKLYFDKQFYKSLSVGAVEKFNNEYEWDVKGLKLKTIYKSIGK